MCHLGLCVNVDDDKDDEHQNRASVSLKNLSCLLPNIFHIPNLRAAIKTHRELPAASTLVCLLLTVQGSENKVSERLL